MERIGPEIEPERDNFPTEPGLYEVTWEDGESSLSNPYEIDERGYYRGSNLDGLSEWYDVPLKAHRHATWNRLRNHSLLP